MDFPKLYLCQRDWENLPPPDGRITVGIDGGYVHARDGTNRKAGSFEVIVGKTITADGVRKCFGFVNGYDQKPKRRLFETLKSQGLQMNQDITFLSDGGDTVRDLQLYLNPFAGLVSYHDASDSNEPDGKRTSQR